ncbi:MAG TPA: LuxR C-terminal-related transcriptional regulator, partial [Anaerolineales bacterium]|nr:LuxR C-terminal-related transcriptional regulator [Anaerolineales bacterium]
ADHAERTDRSIPVILHSHVLAARGDLQAALSLLQPRLERARQAGQVTLWLREGVQAVLILGSAGQRHEAVVLLRELVAAAETIDYRQVFRRHRDQLEPLLGAARDAAPTFVDDLRITAPALIGDARTSLVEPLTDREGEIVRLLTAGLSNAEIAERLFLAPSTIKWYLSEVYGKLGVRRRTEAVARARELGLI